MLVQLRAPPSLVAPTFRNGMSYHHVNACIISATNASKTYIKLVNIGKVVFESVGLKFYDRRLFGTLLFLKGLEKRCFAFSILIGSHCCSSCRNFVRFISATSEFKT